jgi:hypothetical protein
MQKTEVLKRVSGDGLVGAAGSNEPASLLCDCIFDDER